VPDQVAGQHADQHVGFDPVVEAVMDGPQVQIVDLYFSGYTFKPPHHCRLRSDPQSSPKTALTSV
jgi:hypothetical protein